MSGSTIRIDEQMNLTIPIDRGDGATIWVHASPISREIFEKYWLVLSKTFAALYGEGLSIIAGPRIAALMLKRCAETLNAWDGPDGIERGLMGEIRRLANVVVPAPPNAPAKAGWQVVPLETAQMHNMIDPDDVSEIEGVLVFFSLAWRLHRKAERREIIDGAARLWGASMSSQKLSEFANSLRTLTETVSSGATPPTPSSPPYSTGPADPDLKPVSGSEAANFHGAPRLNSARGT